MTSQGLEDLLCLLTAVVVADKRVLGAKVRAFLKQVSALQTTLNIEPKWSEAKILMWYENHKGEVRKQAFGPYLKTWLYDCVDRLSGIEEKSAVLGAMRQIALADGNICVKERSLIVLTARQWGLNLTG